MEEASPKSDGVGTSLTGTDAYHVFDRHDDDLAVANLLVPRTRSPLPPAPPARR